MVMTGTSTFAESSVYAFITYKIRQEVMETESATTFVGCPMQNKNVEPQQGMAKIVSPSQIPASQLAVNERPPPPPPRDCKLLACRTWARSHH